MDQIRICSNKFHINIIAIEQMLRRCLTPNPHSKTKYLSELVQSADTISSRESAKINYDTFIYVDRLTNNKIQLGEAKNMYSQKQKKQMIQTASSTKHGKKFVHSTSTSRQKQYSQSKQMQEINDCFSIMKSTKLFQMQNLKNKLFNKAQENDDKENHEIQQMIKKKKKIRQFIEHYLNSLCLNQFRKYMQPSQDREKIKLINPNLLNIHKVMSNKINKHNIQKIIEEFLHSESDLRKRKPPINIQLDQLDFPYEERLKQLLLHRMFAKNKEFQHLIKPSHSEQIYNQIHSNIETQIKTKRQTERSTKLDECQFSEFAEGAVPKFDKPKRIKWKPLDKKLQLKKRQLLISIQNGSIYNFLFLIIRWPDLLHYRDQLGNTLLHMAGKHNHPDIFSMLVQKLGHSALKQKNNCGKTPIEVSKLFGSHDVQKLAEEYQNFV